MEGSSPDDKAIPWIAASKSSDQKQHVLPNLRISASEKDLPVPLKILMSTMELVKSRLLLP